MDTTICVDEDVFCEIKYFADLHGCSMSEIIKKLLYFVCTIDGNIVIRNKLVEYQNHIQVGGYKVFHYILSDKENEMFSSARQRLKISVSKLLLAGFLLFFKKMIKMYEKNGKNEIINLNNYSYLVEKLYYTIENYVKIFEIKLE